MDRYHRAVAARLEALRQAGEHEKANELEAQVHEVDRLLGR